MTITMRSLNDASPLHVGPTTTFTSGRISPDAIRAFNGYAPDVYDAAARRLAEPEGLTYLARDILDLND